MHRAHAGGVIQPGSGGHIAEAASNIPICWKGRSQRRAGTLTPDPTRKGRMHATGPTTSRQAGGIIRSGRARSYAAAPKLLFLQRHPSVLSNGSGALGVAHRQIRTHHPATAFADEGIRRTTSMSRRANRAGHRLGAAADAHRHCRGRWVRSVLWRVWPGASRVVLEPTVGCVDVNARLRRRVRRA